MDDHEDGTDPPARVAAAAPADQAEQDARDALGRFVPGKSGNPRGRKPGVPDLRQLVGQAVGDDPELDVDEAVRGVMRSMVRLAQGGDVAAARLVMDRLVGAVERGPAAVAVAVGVTAAPPAIPDLGDWLAELERVHGQQRALDAVRAGTAQIAPGCENSGQVLPEGQSEPDAILAQSEAPVSESASDSHIPPPNPPGVRFRTIAERIAYERNL